MATSFCGHTHGIDLIQPVIHFDGNHDDAVDGSQKPILVDLLEVIGGLVIIRMVFDAEIEVRNADSKNAA